MTDDPAYAAQPPLAEPGTYDYDAFLSYSRADAAVAEGIQKGLHSIGRKMGRLHALRVFRDKTDLAASPSLWSKLTEALDNSRYLVVVLSPHAAGSEWVDKEIDYWLTHRDRNNLILVLADGTLVWDNGHGRFDPNGSTAAPPALEVEGSLGAEPVYVDVSQDNPWDIHNPVFRDKLTDIAAPIHGKPKYELASDDLREQQRFRRYRRLAIATLALLLVISLAATGVAFVKQREAQQQRNEAVAGRLASDGEAILKKIRGGGDDRALQELISAYRIAPTVTQGGLLSGLEATVSTRKIFRSPDRVSAVAITPDGKRIVFGGGDDPIIHVIDAQTGESLNQLKGHTKRVSSLALGADGTRLVSASNDKTVRVWDMATGAPLGEPLKISGADEVAISPDGARVATSAAGGGDHIVHVWDVNASTPVERRLVGHSQSGGAVAFSPDGTRIVTGSRDGTIVLWNAGTGERIGLPMHANETIVYSVEFSPDGRRIVSGHNDGSVRQWDAETGQPIGEPMTGHSQAPHSVTYSPDGKLIASGSWDKTVRLWSAETGKPVTEPMAGHENWVTQVVFAPDGRTVISGSDDATIRVWATDQGQFGRTTTTLGVLYPATLSHDGQLLAGPTSSKDSSIAVGDNVKENQVTSWQLGSDVKVRTIEFSPDNRRLAIGMSRTPGSRVGAVQVFDVESGTRLIEIPRAHENETTSLAFSPDGKRIASSGRESAVKIWDAATGKQLGSDLIGTQGDVYAVAFSPDGSWLAAGGEDGLRVWDTETGAPLGNPMSQEAGVMVAAFSPDGRLIASGGAGLVRLWDAHTHQLIGAPLTGHEGAVVSLAFSPDGRLLASGGNDHSVRIWDIHTGQQIGSPLVPGYASEAIAFSPDGQRLVFTSVTGSVTTWPGPARWPDLLCDKLSTNMSRSQWKQWVSPDIEYVAGCPNLPVPE